MNDLIQIKPHDSTWDIFRAANDTYIVRNDLKEGNAFCLKFQGAAGEKGGAPEIYDMSPPISGADHYLGMTGPWHYCIKGERYLRVSNIVTGADLETAKLHPDFKGGTHYFQRNHFFYCVKDGNTLLRAGRLSSKPTKYTLSKDIVDLDPLCMWANGDYVYILSQKDSLVGLVVNRTTGSLDSKKLSFKPYAVTDAAKSFMPGGLAGTQGRAHAAWEFIGGEDNSEGEDVINYSRLYKFEQGQSKEKIKTIENNWSIKLTSTISTEVSVGALVAKAELSLETAFGGSVTKSNTNAWYSKEAVEEKIAVEIKPGENFRIYQPKAGFKELGDVLAGQYVTTKNGKTPTADINKYFEDFDGAANNNG